MRRSSFLDCVVCLNNGGRCLMQGTLSLQGLQSSQFRDRIDGHFPDVGLPQAPTSSQPACGRSGRATARPTFCSPDRGSSTTAYNDVAHSSAQYCVARPGGDPHRYSDQRQLSCYRGHGDVPERPAGARCDPGDPERWLLGHSHAEAGLRARGCTTDGAVQRQ